MKTIWSEFEINYLKENYKSGATFCSKTINRPITAIRRKARILKLSSINNKFEYSFEILSKIVANNKSITDILKTLNLRCAGGNYKTIQNYIIKYNLNTEHFETSSDKAKRILKKEILSIDKILCINSKVNRTTVKKYIFKHNLLKNICSLCNQDENWNGLKMTLILDHINGIYNDNQLHNLRIVCPNCNATLDTHCGKNKKRK